MTPIIYMVSSKIFILLFKDLHEYWSMLSFRHVSVHPSSHYDLQMYWIASLPCMWKVISYLCAILYVILYLVVLGVILGCLFEIFKKKYYIAINVPLTLLLLHLIGFGSCIFCFHLVLGIFELLFDSFSDLLVI